MAPAQLPVFRAFLLRHLRDDPSMGYRELLSILKQQWDVSVGRHTFQQYIADLREQMASGADRDYVIATCEDEFRIHYMHLRCILCASPDMPLEEILQKLRDDYQIDLAMPLLTQVVCPCYKYYVDLHMMFCCVMFSPLVINQRALLFVYSKLYFRMRQPSDTNNKFR